MLIYSKVLRNPDNYLQICNEKYLYIINNNMCLYFIKTGSTCERSSVINIYIVCHDYLINNAVEVTQTRRLKVSYVTILNFNKNMIKDIAPRCFHIHNQETNSSSTSIKIFLFNRRPLSLLAIKLSCRIRQTLHKITF